MLHVFMRCAGRTTTELQRGLFPITATPMDALAHFERERAGPIRQRVVKDEHEFALSAELLSAPMTALSSGCKLNLVFTDDRAQLTGAASGIVNVAAGTADAAQRGWNGLPNWLPSMGGKEPGPKE